MTEEQRKKRSNMLAAHYTSIADSQLEVFLAHARDRHDELTRRQELVWDEIEVITAVKRARSLA
jgi:inactivated superfamily I helicase